MRREMKREKRMLRTIWTRLKKIWRAGDMGRYDIYTQDVLMGQKIANAYNVDELETLARWSARRVAGEIAFAYREHMELPQSHELPEWMAKVLEKGAPD
jgi:hypothetical protein